MLKAPDPLRSALAKANRGSVTTILADLDAEAAAAQQAADAEASRLQKAHAKVAEELPARTAALVADWVALAGYGGLAVEDAAERLGREQLNRAHGVVPARTAAMMPAPPRLSQGLVESSLRRLAEQSVVSYDLHGRTSAAFRSDQARASADATPAKAPKPSKHKGRSDAERQAEQAARKHAAGLPGW